MRFVSFFGNISSQYLLENKVFNLDINYFIDFKKAYDYKINEISFTVLYDSNNFSLDENELRFLGTREAASYTFPDLSFEIIEEGQLQITLAATSPHFVHSGRILDIPFHAKTDLTEGAYTFSLAEGTLFSDQDTGLPTLSFFDGSLSFEASPDL